MQRRQFMRSLVGGGVMVGIGLPALLRPGLGKASVLDAPVVLLNSAAAADAAIYAAAKRACSEARCALATSVLQDDAMLPFAEQLPAWRGQRLIGAMSDSRYVLFNELIRMQGGREILSIQHRWASVPNAFIRHNPGPTAAAREIAKLLASAPPHDWTELLGRALLQAALGDPLPQAQSVNQRAEVGLASIQPSGSAVSFVIEV